MRDLVSEYGTAESTVELVKICLTTLYLVSMITSVLTVSDLIVPPTRTVGFGPRSFPVSDPLAWNSLPSEMKMTSLFLG